MPSKESSKTKEPSKKVNSSSSKKRKTPPAPSKSNISAEFVADSDSEAGDDDLPEKPVAKAPTKANGPKNTKEKSKKGCASS